MRASSSGWSSSTRWCCWATSSSSRTSRRRRAQDAAPGGEPVRVASGGRVERRSRGRARAESVVVPLPRRITGERLDLVRLVPSGRALGIAFLVVAGAVLAWYGARETGVFSVRTVDVAGAPGPVTAQVRHVLADTRGTSLLKVDLEAARQEVEALPTIQSARFDRAYPHTLRVVVVPERPVAVVRQGADSYLVAASGRVVADVGRRSHPALARIWVGRNVVLDPATPPPATSRPRSQPLLRSPALASPGASRP